MIILIMSIDKLKAIFVFGAAVLIGLIRLIGFTTTVRCEGMVLESGQSWRLGKLFLDCRSSQR